MRRLEGPKGLSQRGHARLVGTTRRLGCSARVFHQCKRRARSDKETVHLPRRSVARPFRLTKTASVFVRLQLSPHCSYLSIVPVIVPPPLGIYLGRATTSCICVYARLEQRQKSTQREGVRIGEWSWACDKRLLCLLRRLSRDNLHAATSCLVTVGSQRQPQPDRTSRWRFCQHERLQGMARTLPRTECSSRPRNIMAFLLVRPSLNSRSISMDRAQ